MGFGCTWSELKGVSARRADGAAADAWLNDGARAGALITVVHPGLLGWLGLIIF